MMGTVMQEPIDKTASSMQQYTTESILRVGRGTNFSPRASAQACSFREERSHICTTELPTKDMTKVPAITP